MDSDLETGAAARRVLIALDAGVAVKPADFAEVWERDPEARRVGAPVVEQSGAEVFVPGVLELIAIPLVVNLGSSALYELVKRLVVRARGGGDGDADDLEVAEVVTSAGDTLVVVRPRRPSS